MSYTEITQTFWLKTPSGEGICFGVIDYGPEHHLLWLVADSQTGAIVAWPNPEVRFTPNRSLLAPRDKPFSMKASAAKRK